MVRWVGIATKLVIAGRCGRAVAAVDRVNPVSRLRFPNNLPRAGPVAKVEHLSHPAGGGGVLRSDGAIELKDRWALGPSNASFELAHYALRPRFNGGRASRLQRDYGVRVIAHDLQVAMSTLLSF